MTEEEIQKELQKLPNRLQVAFLAGCIEHINYSCTDYKIVEPAIEISWSYAINNTYDKKALAAIISTYDDEIDEDSNTELIHIAAAAELLATSLETPNNVVIQVFNNIERIIDVLDPEPDLGIIEERQWQVSALKIVSNLDETSLTRDLFAEISSKKMEWMFR